MIEHKVELSIINVCVTGPWRHRHRCLFGISIDEAEVKSHWYEETLLCFHYDDRVTVDSLKNIETTVYICIRKKLKKKNKKKTQQ